MYAKHQPTKERDKCALKIQSGFQGNWILYSILCLLLHSFDEVLQTGIEENRFNDETTQNIIQLKKKTSYFLLDEAGIIFNNIFHFENILRIIYFP